MDMWRPFRFMQLPEEQRAEVMKTQIAEVEATKRKTVEEREKTKQAKLGNENYYNMRMLGVGAIGVLIIAGSIVAYNAVDAWHDVKVKQISATMPPAPVAPPSLVPSFNITVTPVTSAAPASSK